MKNIKLILGLFLAVFVLNSCEIDGINTDTSYINSASSANSNKIFDISTDNSGAVKITPVGEGASKFLVAFGHGTGINASALVLPGNSVTHNYPEGSYTVTITTYDLAGKETVNTYPLKLTYVAPTDLKVTPDLSGYKLNLGLSAKKAMGGFLVYFGDKTNEVGTPVAGTVNSAGEVTATVSHTYATSGNFTVKVVALSGGAAQATTSQVVKIYEPYKLPVTFENEFQNYNQGGVFGGVDAVIVDNPFSGGLNTTAKVWKFTKGAGAESWAGTWTPMSAPNSVPINIDNGSKFVMLVYATETGKALHFQLEQPSTGGGNKAIDVNIPVANQWVELTFDFSTLGIPAGTTFGQYVFQYNLAGSGTGEVIYIDNIRQTN